MSFLDGRFRLGVNFWARAHGPRMWSRAGDVVPELAQARAIGFDLLRIFAFAPDFVRGAPGGYHVLEEPLQRMARFADHARANDLSLLVSPLVGHMSGENFDLPGAGARSLFEDPALREGARLLVEAVVDAIGKNAAGYALTNEAPLWGGLHEGKRPAPAAIVAWAEAMISTARRAGVPVGLGDGLMPEFPNAALREHVDFVGPHVYGGDADPLRHGYRYDHALALAMRADKPVLLEEFGGSSAQCGEREHAALWQEGLYAALTLGARGALGWCWSDFDPRTTGLEAPYEHHGFELGFGITRKDGSEKPAADTLRAWRALVDSLPDAPPVAQHDAVLVRSSYLETPYPFSWMDRGLCERGELTAFAIASQAALTPRICDEQALLEVVDASLYLVPSTQRLLTSTWLALLERARAGATVYWSWFGGDHAFHQGDWCPIFEELTGCRHRLRYGCFDLPDDELSAAGLQLPTGATEVRRGFTELAPACAYIPVEPVTARVLVAMEQGPLLVEHVVGRGRVVFATAPLERYAARLVDGTRRGVAGIYAQLGGTMGGASMDERLCARRITVGERKLVALMNRSWEPVLPPSWNGPLWSHAPLGPLKNAMGPKEVRIFDADSIDSAAASR